MWTWLTVLLSSATAAAPPSRLTVVDVGYGVAVVATDGSGAAVVVDGGYAEEGPGLLEAFTQAGVETLDLAVVSHGHEDHVGGITFLLERLFPIRRVAGNVPWQDPTFPLSFWAACGSVPYTQLRAGDSLVIGTMVMRVLHPRTPGPDMNASSMVVQLVVGGHAVLLPADIDLSTQASLAREWGPSLRSAVLVAPHHGDCVADAFWELVDPEWVVISVGPNPWGMPDTTTVTRAWERRVVDTRSDGTVVLAMDRPEVEVVSRSPRDAWRRRQAQMDERLERWHHGR